MAATQAATAAVTAAAVGGTTALLPRRLWGVWRRMVEEEPRGSGAMDKTTEVFWVQTGCGLYADIRIRAEEDDGSVARLARNKSFAGQSSVAWEGPGGLDDDATAAALTIGDVAPIAGDDTYGTDVPDAMFRVTWEREIDFQPPTGGGDVGDCFWRPSGGNGVDILVEDGAFDDYREVWERVEGGDGGQMAMEKRDAAGRRRAIWVVSGTHFLVAEADEGRWDTVRGGQGKGETFSSMAALFEALGVGEDEDAQREVVQTYTAMYGVRDGGAWKITHSTDPSRVGTSLDVAGGIDGWTTVWASPDGWNPFA